MGKRVSSGLLTLTAVGAGNGGAITNAVRAIPMPTGNPPQGAVRLVVRKIAWYNQIGINGILLVGYGDRTVAGSLFRQVYVPITIVNGVDDMLEPPIFGNTPEGFMIDTTAVTGTLGDIYVECTTVGIGVATPVFVVVEAEML
jgi:hypothetical protein